MKTVLKIVDSFFKGGRVKVDIGIDNDPIAEVKVKKREIKIKVLSIFGMLNFTKGIGVFEGLDMSVKLMEIANELNYKIKFW